MTESMLRRLQRAERLTFDGQAFRIYQLYRFLYLPNSPRAHTYLPVNRHYKPVGIADGTVNYDDYLSIAVVFAGHPRRFAGIWHDSDGLTLYSDEPASRLDYFERLERLFSFAMPTFGSFPPTASEMVEFRRASFEENFPRD